MNCVCAHEMGDGDCPVHPSCPECGSLLEGTSVNRRIEEAEKMRAQLSRARRVVEVATTIMQMCNEMLECPFCGGDEKHEAEHDRECVCHELDVALGGPRDWCDCPPCAGEPIVETSPSTESSEEQ